MDGDETRGMGQAPLRPAMPPAGMPSDATPPPAAATPGDATPPPAAATPGDATPPPATAPDDATPDFAAPLRTAAPPDISTPPPAAQAPPRTGRRRRITYAHALRRGPLPRAAFRRVAAWTRHPSGRITLPGLLLLLTIVATGGAGAFLVPATAERAAEPATGAPSGTGVSATPGGTSLPITPPGIGGTAMPPTGSALVQRPADVLKGWAAQMSPKVDVPTVALEAYGYAELVAGQTNPACGLKWTTLAAIGKVESAHGSANGATLLADGRSNPTIYGSPLDGTGGTMKIADTDDGVLDGDTNWDRAVGPMQFIPTTWEGQATDADNDGTRDPNDIDDAALAAANYLCRGGRNLANIAEWWAAILTYNDVQPYAQEVYQAANDYGLKSRT